MDIKMDTVTSEQRSENMKKIRSNNTKPEIYFRKLLFAQGLRYRLHDKKIPGKPDIFLKKYNTAIFINGCFWHQHKDCKYARIPKTNPEYWIPKLERNQKRDREVKEQLMAEHIRVIVIWECLLKRMRKDPELEKTIIRETVQFLKENSDEYLDLS